MVTYDNLTDAQGLPPAPFSLYFIDEDGQVNPKRIFTVTRTLTRSNHVELFVSELQQHVVLDLERMQVCMFEVN
jgi:hypothetical protein